MSYKQAMRWAKKHPRGTRQPVLMHTGSGFWPAWSWTVGMLQPYIAACAAIGVEPVNGKEFYDLTCSGRDWCGLSPEACAERTAARHRPRLVTDGLPLFDAVPS